MDKIFCYASPVLFSPASYPSCSRFVVGRGWAQPSLSLDSSVGVYIGLNAVFAGQGRVTVVGRCAYRHATRRCLVLDWRVVRIVSLTYPRHFVFRHGHKVGEQDG